MKAQSNQDLVQGTVTKGVGGFYTVVTENGDTYACRARGKFRKNGIVPTVGDKVAVRLTAAELCEGYLTDVLPRKNTFFRPSVANVDLFLVTFAVRDPMPSLSLIDKLTVTAVRESVDCAICINKADLDHESAQTMREIYRQAGYTAVVTSVREHTGLEELKNLLKNKITAFAGASGVGKSSLINRLGETFTLKTGAVSEKIKRGKHTTRHTELFPLSFGGYVFDTPGFGSFEIEKMTADHLRECFLEFSAVGACKFADCRHINEPGCAVRQAVQNGQIAPSRYESYTEMFEELKNVRDWQL